MRRLIAILLISFGLAAAPAARAQDGVPLVGDDGTPVSNHPVTAALAEAIAALPAVVTVGNPAGQVTLYEFYDLNCPYCRKAAPEIAALVHADNDLKLVLVPFPVLSIASIQAGRVEFALARLATPAQFYDFHRRIYAGRGVVDGNRALAVAKQLGFDTKALIAAADDDGISEAMKAHVRLGDALALAATPAFVIAGVAIVGYPGPKALKAIVQSAHRCGRIAC